MKPIWFDRASAPKVPIYDGGGVSHRMVTRAGTGYEALGLHVSEGAAGLSGKGSVVEGRDEIIFILAGGMTIDAGEGPRTLGPEQGVIIPAGMPFDWAAGPQGWKALVVYTPPLV
jgi:mannose-6-phosphate isomerase-like protein (cupin superfamily)